MDVRKLAHAIDATPTSGVGVKPQKAYKNAAWVGGSHAKALRVMNEMQETEVRMAGSGVNKTILFFGSARSKSPEDHALAVAHAQGVLSATGTDARERAAAEEQLSRLARTAWMSAVYPSIQALARRLTEWSMSRIGPDGRLPYAVATGGGPGLMEAANRGAAEVEGALTIGCGISLPFEERLNPYVTPELSWEYHYFFVRKFSMCYWCRAFIVAPGGFGSFDELFEVLTLCQTSKIDHPDLLPIVLFGTAFWTSVVNWQMLADMGTISQADVARLFITDSVEDAFAHVTGKLLAWEAASVGAAAKAAAEGEQHTARLSAPARAFLRVSAAKAAVAAATTGLEPATLEEGGVPPAPLAAPGPGTGEHAKRAAFLAPSAVSTPGGTVDTPPPTLAELTSPLSSAAARNVDL